MKINLEKFLKNVKLKTVKNSNWYEEGYKTIKFRNSLSMTHSKKGEFAYIDIGEIEIEIPNNLLKKLKK